MSTRTRTRFQLIAAVASIAVMGSFALNAGGAHAEDGPVCEEPEAPVCEEPMRITAVDPNGGGFVTSVAVRGFTF